MEAVGQRARFSLAVQVYLWLFLALLAFVPVLITRAVADRASVPPLYWIATSVWPILIAIGFLYAERQCSSDAMTFRDGLLWVAASMRTGWLYQTFFTLFPSLTVAFFCAIVMAILGDLRRDAKYAPDQWRRIVSFFYDHRMRQ